MLDLSLTLTSILVRIFSASWLFIVPPPSTPLTERATKTSKRFALLVVHVVCTEVRLMIDTAGDLHGDNSSSNSVIMENEATSRPRRMLPLCFEILEAVIGVLVKMEGGDGIHEDDGFWKSIDSIRLALTETFGAVVAFLVERMEIYQIEENWAILDNPITAFSMRALGTWIAESPTEPTSDFTSAIPLIVAFLNGDRLVSMAEVHAVEFLGPALTNLSCDEAFRIAFVDSGGVQACTKVLSATVSGTLNVSGDVVASIVGVVLNIVVVDAACVKVLKGVFEEVLGTCVSMSRLIESDGWKIGAGNKMVLQAQSITLSVFLVRVLDEVAVRRVLMDGGVMTSWSRALVTFYERWLNEPEVSESDEENVDEVVAVSIRVD
ncbi:hypothetical protein HK096_009643 [Nowakowskiella sp. JEL0078]|nr:hypothetical protein HK096_009643 [Nowakowskiella sp. JEL0078]